MRTEYYKGQLLILDDSTGIVFQEGSGDSTIVYVNVEAAKREIDNHISKKEHPWLSGSLREIVRLIRGERLLPHGTEECSICDEAFDLALRARRAKMHEAFDKLLNDQAIRKEIST